MRKSILEIDGTRLPCYALNTLLIGSGAACLNAAVHLYDNGQKDIAIATDCWGGGTSNNTGSDKQTYYKLSLAGDKSDSPLEMARDLYQGGCMHGDIALCEAQNSMQAFYHLIKLGVPFPHDRYGAYVGYKTDHDPRQRATSAGPLTSQLMFTALAAAVKEREIKIFNQYEVITLLTSKRDGKLQVTGAIALDNGVPEENGPGFVVFNAVNIVLGTGGPAGIYKTSVYPESQLGSSGMAYAAGAVGQNLTESQFGLASIKFRWNLSGSYQQVIPRYISLDKKGGDEEEFLNKYFPDMGKLATAVFLKGYQWPFDPRKVENYGSSLIDILVYQETELKGRRVFLDFSKNPSGKDQKFSLDLLAPEAYQYLKKSDALAATPIKRLENMNRPAIELYKKHNIDISKEPLEIAVCAQHNNGGLKGNIWWESNLKHLFTAGEVNGSHGVYRPGGSALNSGQVGSMRAALYISRRYQGKPINDIDFIKETKEQIEKIISYGLKIIVREKGNDSFLKSTRKEIQERMTTCGAHIRRRENISKAIKDAWQLYDRIKKKTKITSPKKLSAVFKNIDLCLVHALYLEAIKEYMDKGGKSRGSYLILEKNGNKPCSEMGNEWKFSLTENNSLLNRQILEISWDGKGNVGKKWMNVRPVPEEETWFEMVWKKYLKDKIIGE